VDIEDAVRKGILRWSDVYGELAGLDGMSAEVRDEITAKIHDYCSCDPTGANVDGEEYVQLFRIFGLSIVSPYLADTFQEHYNDIMSGSFASPLYKMSRAKDLIATLKSLERGRVHRDPQILRTELMGKHILHDLLTFFYESVRKRTDYEGCDIASFEDKTFALMSRNYRAVMQEDLATCSEPYCKLKLILDYVSGMTDTFAYELHRQLFRA